MWNSLPTIFPSSKVLHRAFPKAYGALKRPLLNRGSTPFYRALEQSTPFVLHLSHLLLHLRGSQHFCSILEDSTDMTMLGTTNLHNDMILSTLSISSHGFAFGFPKKASYEWK